MKTSGSNLPLVSKLNYAISIPLLSRHWHQEQRGQQQESGADRVAAALEGRQHPQGVRLVGGLAQARLVQKHHGVTGGVYKTRERIHRSILICDY